MNAMNPHDLMDIVAASIFAVFMITLLIKYK